MSVDEGDYSDQVSDNGNELLRAKHEGVQLMKDIVEKFPKPGQLLFDA